MSRPVPLVRKPQANTRTQNAKHILPHVDGRSMWMRRLHEIVAELVEEMGGPDIISAVQLSIAKRCGTQTVAIERLEVEIAEAGEATLIQLEVHQRMSNTLRRNLESLGIKPRSAPKPKTIHEILSEA